MFSCGNLGVGALSIANLLIISEECKSLGIKPKFYLLGYKEKNIDYSFELNNYEIDYEIIYMSYKQYILNSPYFYKIFNSAHVIFEISAGDSFSDIYGNKRFIKIITLEVFSLLLKKPLVFSPQTIGPFKSKSSTIIAKFILNKCKAVFARDYKSYHVAEQLIKKDQNSVSTLHEAIDVAMILPYTKNQKTKTDKIVVGLNVSALLYYGGYTQNNQFSLTVDYQELIKMLIEHFKSLENVGLVLVAHVLNYQKDSLENDYEVCSQLAKKHDIKVAPFFKSPIEAKSYISHFDFFIGARMHATIAAFSSGVAVVPMAYSRKFGGLYSSLDYSFLVDMTLKNTNESFDLIVDYYRNKELLQKSTIAGKQKAIEKLNDYKKTVKGILNEYKPTN